LARENSTSSSSSVMICSIRLMTALISLEPGAKPPVALRRAAVRIDLCEHGACRVSPGQESSTATVSAWTATISLSYFSNVEHQHLGTGASVWCSTCSPHALVTIPVMMHCPCALPKQKQAPLLPCLHPLQTKSNDPGMWPHPAPQWLLLLLVISETSHPTLSLVDSSSVSSKPCPAPFVSTDRFIDRFGERTAMSTILLLHRSPRSRSLLLPSTPTVQCPLSPRFGGGSFCIIFREKDNVNSPSLLGEYGSAAQLEGTRPRHSRTSCLSAHGRSGWCLVVHLPRGRGAFWVAMGHWNAPGSRSVAPGLNAMLRRRFQLITQLKEMKEKFGNLEAESNPFLTMLGA
jgi:hypothetical protein